jgi:hypothetical protein
MMFSTNSKLRKAFLTVGPSLLLLFIFALPYLAEAKTLYLKSMRAKLLAGPKHGTKVVLQLKRGATLSEVKRDKKWVQVKIKSKTGWLPSILASSKKPMQRKSLLMKNVDISKNARKRASTFTSTAAARGLKANSDDVFNNLEGANFQAVKVMESTYVPFKVAIPFLRSGLTGERNE